RKLFVPCTKAFASALSPAAPSAISVTTGGMPKTTQCTQVPAGASGSSQISARLLVPLGGWLHFKGGETFLPSPVYCFGIGCPLRNAGLVTSNFMALPPFA